MDDDELIGAYVAEVTGMANGELEARLAEVADPVARLKLRAAATASAGATLTRRFERCAYRWAATRGVCGKALADEGVPAAVLRRAGIDPRATRPPPVAPLPRLRPGELVAWLDAHPPRTISVADLAAEAAVTATTARNALAAAENAGLAAREPGAGGGRATRWRVGRGAPA